MGQRGSMTDAQRQEAVALLEAGLGRDAIATRLGVPPAAMRRLHDRWLVAGADAMTPSSKRSYPVATKREAVARYTAGEDAVAIAQALGIASGRRVTEWTAIVAANGEAGLDPRPRGRPKRAPDAPVPAATELERLQRENERLRAEVAYLGKLRALSTRPRR